MNAAPNTTERGPKTTSRGNARKSEVRDLVYWMAKKNAQVDQEYEAACAATAEFPALRQFVEVWLPLRRAEADIEAIHADLEERGADDAEVEAAQDRWHAAMAATREAALGVLGHVATDPHVTMAKVATYMAISGARCVEAKDDDGHPNRLVKSLLTDAAMQGDLRRDVALTTEAWDAAMAAYRAAVAEADATGGGDEATDREVEAQEAVLLTPAPHLDAVSVKLSFMGEFNHAAKGDFLTPEVARRMVERGNSWTDRCLAAAYLDLQRLGPAQPPSSEAWDAAAAALAASADEENRLLRALEAASDAAERDAPTPAILRRESGGTYTTEEQVEAAKLPFDQKVAMVTALREWMPVRQAALAAHRVEELDEAWRDHSVCVAEDALIRTPAPNAQALALKLGLVVSRHMGVSFEELQTVECITGLLTSDEPDERDLALTYQDALRLAGQRPDLVAAEAFDAAAWIANFEALPGHTMELVSDRSQAARPEFADPIAWGPDMPAFDDIKVTDPAAIARYEAAVRASYTDEEWEEAKQTTQWASRFGKDEAFTAAHPQHVEKAYPDETDPERQRLLALLELRRQRSLNERKPLGAGRWGALTLWQRKAVSRYVVDHPELFPERRAWTPEAWRDAFSKAGGSLHFDGKEHRYGLPVPSTRQQERLIAVLEDGRNAYLKEQVKLLVQAEQEGGEQ